MTEQHDTADRVDEIREILTRVAQKSWDDPAQAEALELIRAILGDQRPRTWFGEALAAFDQSLTVAGDEPGFPPATFWVSRAQAAAAIASAQQARIANLIAWKALQVQRSSAPDNGLDLLDFGGDELTIEIVKGLGIQ